MGLRVRWISWPLSYKLTGKYESDSRFVLTNRNHTIISESWPLTPFVIIREQLMIAGSMEGQLRSHDVTICFPPITRDRMEIQTYKWCQTTQYASEDMHIELLGSRPDLDLTWPEKRFWNWYFKVEKYMIRTGSKRRTRWCQFHFHVSHQKSYQWKPSPRKKRFFFIWGPLEPKLLSLGKIWSIKLPEHEESSPKLFKILPNYRTFGNNSNCEKWLFSPNLAFGDLWS